MTREPIYAALFAKFAALTAGESPPLKQATRRPDVWQAFPKEDRPALLQMQSKERVERVTGKPTKWTFDVRLLLYVATQAQSDPSVIPTQTLNPLVDALSAALTIDDPIRNTCSLGGLVYSCAIDGGEITYYPGNFGDEAVAELPVRIVVTE